MPQDSARNEKSEAGGEDGRVKHWRQCLSLSAMERADYAAAYQFSLSARIVCLTCSVNYEFADTFRYAVKCIDNYSMLFYP